MLLQCLCRMNEERGVFLPLCYYVSLPKMWFLGRVMKTTEIKQSWRQTCPGKLVCPLTLL